LVLYWPALFVLTHIPIPHVVQEADVSDKSLHFLAYLILTFLIWSAVYGDRKVKWSRAGPWFVLLTVCAFGILDEWLQGYVAGRSCDVKDFFMDLAGALTGLVLCSFLSFWPAGLLVVATLIFGVTNVTQANLTDLLPVTNVIFHFLAYAVLTAQWIRCVNLFSIIKASKAKGFLLGLAGPSGFLIIVELFSVITGKDFALYEIIISFGAIAAIVIGFHGRHLAR